MLNSVSAVSFKANPTVQSAQERINAPGKFTKPEASTQNIVKAPKKKHTLLKVLGGLVGAAVVVAAGTLIGVKTDKLKVLPDLNGAKFMQKVGHYLGKMGEWIDTNMWQRVVKLFSKNPQAPNATP